MTTARGGDSSGRRPCAGFVALSAIAGAVVVAVVMLPKIRFAAEVGAADGGVAFSGAKDGEFYAAQIRHVLDGTYGHANDLLFETSGGPAHAPPWTYSLLAALHRLVGGTLHGFLGATIAVCATIQYALLLGIARTVRIARPVAVAAAAAACLAPFLWSYHGGELWLGFADRVTTGFLPLFRPVNPSVSSVLVWGAVLALVRWLDAPSRMRWGVLALLVAVQWTAYPAAFLFSGAVVSMAGLAALAAGRRRDGLLTLGAAFAAAAVNVPFIVATTSRFGGSSDALEGNLIALPTRHVILSASTLTACAIGAAWAALRWRRRADATRRAVAVAAPLALVAVFNLQVVTGRIDQPFHYDWFYTGPVAWLAAGVLLTEVGARARAAAEFLARPGVRRALVVAAVALPVVVAALAFGGPAVARVLREAGLIRGDRVARPATLVVAAAAASVAMIVLRELVVRRRRRILALAAGVCGVALAASEGWSLQSFETSRRMQAYIDLQPLGAAWETVAARGTTDDVVLTNDEEAARMVPSYTGRNVFISTEVQFAAAPSDDEFRERRLVAFAIFGLDPAVLEAGLPDGGRFHGAIFKWRTFGPPPPAVAAVSGGKHLAKLAPDAAERVMARYREILAMPRAEMYRRFRLDWIVWREGSGPFADPGPRDGLEPVLDVRGVRVYRVAR